MGVVQRAMVRSCPHVWFERAEMKDRHLVTKRSNVHFTTPHLVIECFMSWLFWYLLGSKILKGRGMCTPVTYNIADPLFKVFDVVSQM